MRAVALAMLIVTLLDGCSPVNTYVTVIGRDAQGRLVVGAARCGRPSSTVDLRVVDPDASFGSETIWSVTRNPGRSSVDPVPSGQVTAASPARLDEVPLYVVGSEHPDLLVVLTGPARPPEVGTVVLEVDFASAFDDREVALDVGIGRDSYVLDLDGRQIGPVSADDAIALIAEECEEAEFDGGRFAAVLGGSAAVALVVCVAIGWLTARQWRRAGARHRTVAAARRGY
ncbi:MAG: hypothetical protein GXY13_12395 [Acidimicrobiales bacterium]|nr:hypothetical protein [Acidimicrobiales bacterium]